ncbi:MAG: hypothetical protein KJ062_01910 [Thermoanaerobaculia bacterium]|nr:hypothetical protein [Thermoanaerobaculia bacterium]
MRSTHLKTGILGLFGAALLSSHPIAAAEAEWVLLGLSTNPVSSIAVERASPGTIYAGGLQGGGLHKSTDAGRTWTVLSTGSIRSIATDPRRHGTLYVGGRQSHFRKSVDGGRTWSTLGFPGEDGRDISEIAVDSRGSVYAGAFAYGCESPCLYRSDDGAETWRPLDTGTFLDVTALAVDPNRPGSLYVGTYGRGAFKTTDGGATLGSISGLSDAFVYSLAVDPRDGNVVYAGGGLTGLLFSSRDGGATWRGATADPWSVRGIAIDERTSPSTVYAGGSGGVFRSRDGGLTWAALVAGAAPRNVSSLAIVATDPPTLLAGSHDGGLYALALGDVSLPTAWLVPSAARAPGAHGAFFTTDLAIANAGAADASFSIQFLGHDVEGTGGPVAERALAAGRSVTYADVLGSLFGVDVDYGALRITSDSPALRISAITTSPPPDGRGRVGQSVPAFDASRLATPGNPAVLVGLRDDASSRTNLLLANATDLPVSVSLSLVDADGSTLGTTDERLLPLGMTQVLSVVEELGGFDRGDVYLVVTVTTPGGAVAACATLVDRVTNDPRSIVP